MHYLGFTWNPLEGFEIGSFTLRFYSLSYVLAFVVGWYLMKKIFLNEREDIEKLDSLFIYMVLAILFGARLGHVIFYQPELFKQDFFSVFLPIRTTPEFEFTGFKGLASHGATIGVVIALILYNKRKLQKNVLWIFDRIAVPAAIGAAFVRLGNFMNSEIVGKISGDYAFGVKLVRNDLNPGEVMSITGKKDVGEAYSAIVNDPQFAEVLAAVPYRHPTQVYEALGYVLTFIIMLAVYWKTDKKWRLGYMFGLFFVLLWSVRFFVEFLKESQGDEYLSTFGLNTGQLLSIPFVIFGLYLMFRKPTIYTPKSA
ncbi:prolipoprotein diacylglyceryl transferase [Gilvibacter sp.]|uniref:prolipoprotein diacylglyceryl transferase n=1 Tax=Gilvibacter sp. TaxID=2729997 RepID=UPI0025C3210D|nr:prolipoprotein diacylglyceryl transferase [Gilvibacter sp.]NQX77897.1 prolipoprotein diacylglyceryl transferase [Gilvibacter sp.]